MYGPPIQHLADRGVNSSDNKNWDPARRKRKTFVSSKSSFRFQCPFIYLIDLEFFKRCHAQNLFGMQIKRQKEKILTKKDKLQPYITSSMLRHD